MNKNIFKYIILGVIGIIVLVLSILGFSKYSKNHSIDINLGIGNHGIGSDNKNGGGTGGGIDFGGNKSKTKKGNFIKCIAYEDSLKATGYFEFRNGTLYNIMQYEISGEAPSDYMKKHTKKDVEDELKSMLCYKESACKNVKISWSGNTITMTLGVDINVVSSSIFEVGMSESEFLSEMSKDKGTTCEKVSKAPIYATETDSSKVYTNSSEKKYKNSTSSTQNTEINNTKQISSKDNTLGFIDAIEYYAGFSQISNNDGYGVPVPGNGEGVTCMKTNKGWDNTCKAFMTAVEEKNKGISPKTATIILNSTGRVQQGTRMTYYNHECLFDGRDVTCK